MKSIDTNIALRLLLRDIPDQADIVESILSRPGEKFAIADYVFAEIVWVLGGKKFNYTRDEISQNIYGLMQLPQINCNRALLTKVLPLYLSLPSLSFVDISLTIYAELNDSLPLLTFDKRLAAKLPEHSQLLTRGS